MWAIPFLLSITLGTVWVRVILGGRPILSVALGIGFGAGISSFLYFLLLVAGIASPAVIAAAHVLLFAAGCVLLLRGRGAAPAERAPALPWTWALAAAVLIGVLVFTASFFETAQANLQGEWDAWAIWNLRAKFLAGDGEAWRGAISPLLNRTHPDYPLLLSSFVAQGWKFCGGETPPAAPIAAALLFTLAVMGLLAALLARASGLLAVLVLLSTSAYLGEASAQYSDIPLSFFLLATLGLLIRGDVMLAGAFASMAAWTKNEGLAFLAVTVVVVFALDRSRVLRYAAGALPGTLIVLSFKWMAAPAAEPLFRTFAPGRWAQVAKAFGEYLLAMGDLYTHPLLLLAILAWGLRFRRTSELDAGIRTALVSVALMLLVYFGVFLTTPADVTWQLSTAMQRLYIQVWPAFLLGMFAWMRRPEDLAPAARPARTKKSR